MAENRYAALSVAAAVEGVIDFRKARTGDANWWRRCRVLLDGLLRRHNNTLLDARYRYHLALLSNSRLTEESFEKAQERSNELYHEIVASLRPWEGNSYVARRQQEFGSAREDYKRAFGVDPLDPAFQKWEAEQIAAMEADTAAAETAEQTAIRRMQERDRLRQKQGR